MLTPILRSRTLGGFLLACFLCGLMIAYSFSTYDPESSGNELLYSHWAFGWGKDHALLVYLLSALLVVLVSAASRLRPGETKQAFVSENLPMTILVAISLVQCQTVFSRPDVLTAMTLTLAMFLLLFSTYKKELVLSELFHVGLLLGLATLFVGQSIFLTVPVGFSILILRTGNWKEWAVFFLGLCMCGVFAMMVTIWHQTPILEFKLVVQSAWSSNFWEANANGGHLTLTVILLLAMIGMFSSLTSGTVTERNLMLSNIAWIVSVLLMVTLLGMGWQEGILLAAFPISVAVARTMERIERWWLADLLLLTVLAAPIASSLWRF